MQSPPLSTSQEGFFQATTTTTSPTTPIHEHDNSFPTLSSRSSYFTETIPLDDLNSAASLIPSRSRHAEPTGPKPSMLLLFSQLSRKQTWLFLIPAILASFVAGGVAPFMTFVIGQSFDAFAVFSRLTDPPQSAKDQLIRSVGIAALELVALAVGALALGTMTSSFWIWTGEYNARALRMRVYEAVTKKDLAWFDTRSEGDEGPVGAGGMMAKFTSEIEDVHRASSLAAGNAIQYLTTCLTCLVLAFLRSWSLTLVILASLPVFVFTQAISQAFAAPLLNATRSKTATAATLVGRALEGIATVKAFNGAAFESSSLKVILNRIRSIDTRLNVVWGSSAGISQFVNMVMFVQGFWFGAKLVREGKASAGDVMSVFWACLIATTNLQMCIPQFIVLTKGKYSMASLLGLVEPPKEDGLVLTRHPQQLRKILPQGGCQGELTIQNVSFSYPSRPSIPVLMDVSLFLPAREMTFIVGDSGSGKSTIAQLLLGMYHLQSGTIHLDDRDLAFLDEKYKKQHIACITQECVLFDMSVHDNVAVGKREVVPTREEVVEVCRAALMHEFVNGLPEGYDTLLGSGGAGLSGGQKQRLAIARALLRNPTVLILDESTSALDATSRLLVFEAIKRWRKNMTTVVITHDLSQISLGDFVYVLRYGAIAEQGYRHDLERAKGEFRRVMDAQGETGGFLPEKDVGGTSQDIKVETEGADNGQQQPIRRRSSIQPPIIGSWALDMLTDLAKPTPASAIPSGTIRRVGTLVLNAALGRPVSSNVMALPPGAAPPRPPRNPLRPRPDQWGVVEEDTRFPEPEDDISEKPPYEVYPPPRRVVTRVKAKLTPKPRQRKKLRKIHVQKASGDHSDRQQSLMRLVLDIFPTVPHKFFVFLGLVICLLSGASTPVFSFLLSRLLFEVSIGGTNVPVINKFGFILLGVAAGDGLLLCLKYFVMETTAMAWVTSLRKRCFKLILLQDKKWFDKSENNPARLVQILIQDGDDARALISEVLGQCVVVTAMLGLGLIWAMIMGWQLTLVGFAIAPVFAAAISIQNRLVGGCELRNKRAREDIARIYHEAVSSVRAIRAMNFEAAFHRQFGKAADRALTVGMRSAFVVGCTYGLANALIYLAEALLFFAGAVLISRGIYTYLQMVQVLNLVVFSVVIASQLMAFTQKTAKAIQATRDLNTLNNLPTLTDESLGIQCPPLNGSIRFVHVSFSHLERPDAQVLRHLSFKIADGESVAIVGSSGSGKSTILSLLQRLYEPSSGTILVGSSRIRIGDMSINHLRSHIAVVSQQPQLFDATIHDNIAYGNGNLSRAEVQIAAKAANVHPFIMSLPQGYDTMVGENASLISGGQAQRLQIARALARPSKILLLDECTSALDAANQMAVMDSISHAKGGRTTIMVTHNLAMMKMCDRIIVIDDGTVKEQGTFQSLIERNGFFTQLARSGEWVG